VGQLIVSRIGREAQQTRGLTPPARWSIAHVALNSQIALASGGRQPPGMFALKRGNYDNISCQLSQLAESLLRHPSDIG
jgi:hypothetical protein